MHVLRLVLCGSLLAVGIARADSPLDVYYLKGYKAEATEPLAAVMSIDKASRFLETISLKWTRQNRCGTCHTNLAYVMATPYLDHADKAVSKEVRDRLFDYLAEYRPGAVPREQAYDNQLKLWTRLSTVSAIAIDDGEAHLTQEARTLKSFDDIWAMQLADGSFAGMGFGAPFLEKDPYYLDTLVALGAGYLPASYLQTPAAARGLQRLEHYLTSNPPKDLHGDLMLMRASVKTPALMSTEERTVIISRTLALQHADGGWGLASLGDWPRVDGAANDKSRSDGYGTGFVLYSLCHAGVPKSASAVQKGLGWLETHQRESGRWFTASLSSSKFQNYLSTMGTAYAVMAVKECADQTNRWGAQ